MKPLVLACAPYPEFIESGFADLAVGFGLFRFAWGPPRSQDELAGSLGSCTVNSEMHWSSCAGRWNQSENRRYRDLSLADFCLHYDTVELWFDGGPDDQLTLIWLLDYFRACPEVLARLKLRLVDQEMMWIVGDGFGDWRPPIVDISERELTTAQAVWQAYWSSTPEACVDLLQTDLTALPLLKPVLLDLLAELPSTSTGLGATEMRMLEMIGRGYSRTNDLFNRPYVRHTSVFSEFECGLLLDGLAFGPKPAVLGLDEALRTMRPDNFRDRQMAYRRSRLSLTDVGKAVVAHKEDFSRHNPIDRWWGGTHLTNDNLWRWSPALLKPWA